MAAPERLVNPLPLPKNAAPLMLPVAVTAPPEIKPVAVMVVAVLSEPVIVMLLPLNVTPPTVVLLMEVTAVREVMSELAPEAAAPRLVRAAAAVAAPVPPLT